MRPGPGVRVAVGIDRGDRGRCEIDPGVARAELDVRVRLELMSRQQELADAQAKGDKTKVDALSAAVATLTFE